VDQLQDSQSQLKKAVDLESSQVTPMDLTSSNSSLDRTSLLSNIREKFTSIVKDLLASIENHPDETEILMEFGDLIKEELRECRPEVFVRWTYTSSGPLDHNACKLQMKQSVMGEF
jgi:hypothetical protein